MSKQPEALRLASVAIFDRGIGWQADATAELIRLHALNAELVEALQAYVSTIATAGGGDKDLFMAAIREVDNSARAALKKATEAA